MIVGLRHFRFVAVIYDTAYSQTVAIADEEGRDYPAHGPDTRAMISPGGTERPDTAADLTQQRQVGASRTPGAPELAVPCPIRVLNGVSLPGNGKTVYVTSKAGVENAPL